MTSAITDQLTWATTTAVLAAALPNYESRTEQDNLAGFVDATLQSGAHGLAQAGCGVGKSFGSLGPAIRWAREHRDEEFGSVVVATATKALQDQYANKDLPFLSKVLGQAGFPFTWTVLKGRSNYVCLDKLQDALDEPGAAALSAELDADETHTGDLDQVGVEVTWQLRKAVTTSSDECPGKKNCPFGNTCFAEKAKTRAQNSDIVVTNHSLLVADALVRRSSAGAVGMLPQYGAVVIDEAHELEEYASSALGNSFSQTGLEHFASEVANFTSNSEVAGPLARRARELFEALDARMPRNQAGKLRERTYKISDRDRVDLQDQFINLMDAIEDLQDAIDEVDVFGNDRKRGQRKRLAKRAANLVERLRDVLTADAADLVRWLELDDKNRLILKYSPLHVGAFLAGNIWQTPDIEDSTGRVIAAGRPRAALLMSATLAVPDFTFIRGRLGLPAAETFDAGSPFDFTRQAALYVPASLPHPSKEADTWKIAAQIQMERLVLANGGRALLLFTSTKAMRDAHAALAEKFEDAGIRVLMQGEGPNRQLAETFKNDETSVLFGLKSFMTGVDFQGPTCSLVILDKLPFAVPTDVLFKARSEAIDESVAARKRMPVSRATWQPDGSFNALSIPTMIMTLLQGFGRAIRTGQDEALVAILDSRLQTERYGRKIMNALPPARRLDAMPDALSFIRAMRG